MNKIKCLPIWLLMMLVSVLSCDKKEKDPDTPPVQDFDISLEVSEITHEAASVSVSPTLDSGWYLFGFASAEELENGFSGDPKLFFDEEIARIMQENGSDRKSAVETIRIKGATVKKLTGLTALTDYKVFAVGVNDEGLYLTEVFTKEFRTSEEGEEPLPDGRFEVSVSDITSGTAVISVKPEDFEMTYYYDVATKSDYESVDGDVSVFVEQLIEYIVATNQGATVEDVVKSLQVKGESSDIIPNLTAETDFVAFAVGLSDDGKCTTKASVKEFRTEPAGKPEDCKFSFKFPQVGSDYAYVTVIPSDNTVKYFTSVVKVSEYIDDEILAERVFESISLAAAEYGIPLSEAVEKLTYSGQYTELHTDLVDNVRYFAFAYVMNSEGRPVGQITKQEFVTSGIGQSDCSVSLKNVKWYDGDALADLDPEYEGLRGGAYFTADVEHSENAATWYVSLSAEDKTDKESFPDETVVTALMATAKANPDKLKFAVYYGEATALGFAMDEAGVFGDVYRELINITKEGASPVEDFVATSNIPLAKMKNKGTETQVTRTILYRNR